MSSPIPIIQRLRQGVDPDDIQETERVMGDAADIVSDMLTVLREAKVEIEQVKADIIGARGDNFMGSAHPKFDPISAQELARIEALLSRINAAIAKATGA
jgi:hypothetical protein